MVSSLCKSAAAWRLLTAAGVGLALCSGAVAAVKVVPAPTAKSFKLAITDPKCDRSTGKITTVEVAVEKAKTIGGYAVVTSSTTYADKDWKKVVDGLAFKHSAPVLVYDKDINTVVDQLAKLSPAYTGVVLMPEEAKLEVVAAVHQLTRKLDKDPYGDTMWGIITGYCASDAARVVSFTKPLVLAKGAGGTPISLERFDEGIWYDEGKKNHGVEKKRGGEAKDVETPDDTTEAIVKTLNELQPDYFQTSGHASERDWAPGYSYPNGRITCKDGVLLGKDLKGNTYTVNSPNPKVYAAYGNCLIGNIPDKNCMALAWFGSGGAVQMLGYTVPTWFGYGGWGVGSYFFDNPGQFSFSESFFLNNQALVNRLVGDPGNDKQGLEYDRDTVALYGDPAWRATLKPQNVGWTQTLTSKNDVYTFDVKADKDVTLGRPVAALLPKLKGPAQLTAGKDLSPVIADNFILLPGLSKLEKGKTYKVSFKVLPGA